MLDSQKTTVLLQRHNLAEELKKLSETFAEVSDGKTTSYVLGVLAHPPRC